MAFLPETSWMTLALSLLWCLGGDSLLHLHPVSWCAGCEGEHLSLSSPVVLHLEPGGYISWAYLLRPEVLGMVRGGRIPWHQEVPPCLGAASLLLPVLACLSCWGRVCAGGWRSQGGQLGSDSWEEVGHFASAFPPCVSQRGLLPFSLPTLSASPQSSLGLSPPGAAAAQEPERPGEHAAGPWDAHHHQVGVAQVCVRLSQWLQEQGVPALPGN